MPPLRSLLIGITTCSFVAAQSNTLQAFCGWQTYGSPLIEDCHRLLESFASHLDGGVRVFDEEQQRGGKDGSWPGLGGIVDLGHLDQAVQTPRYYTLSQFHS